MRVYCLQTYKGQEVKLAWVSCVVYIAKRDTRLRDNIELNAKFN